MELVSSVEHYYSLISGRKEKVGRLKTNCTLTSTAIERYIVLERFFYEETEGGIFFFSDEETYYQAYYYLHEGIALVLNKRTKPILIQNIYKEGKDNMFLSFLNKELKKSGFVLQDTLRHAVLKEPDALFHSLERSIRSIERIFEKKGFKFKKVEYDQLSELRVFMLHIDQIPFYQYPYYSNEEYMEESNTGRLSCIVNEENKIIAARHLIVAGKKAYGWVGIADEYKTLYGIAPMILFKQLSYMRDNNISMCSWVKTTNIPSIQYHNRIGSVWTGQLEDEWLLDSN